MRNETGKKQPKKFNIVKVAFKGIFKLLKKFSDSWVLYPAIFLIITLGGLAYYGHKDLWWFTPAYSQRQATQALFDNITSGKIEKAYKSTSKSLQTSTSYHLFSLSFEKLEHQKYQIIYTGYAVNKDRTAISALMYNPRIKTFYNLVVVVLSSAHKAQVTELQIAYRGKER